MSRASSLPLFQRALTQGKRLAIIDKTGRHTYADLLTAAHQVTGYLLSDQPDLREARVAFLVPPSLEYAAVQWGIWQAGGVAVPLCPSYPRLEIEHILRDTKTEVVVTHPDFESPLRTLARGLKVRFLLTSEATRTEECSVPEVTLDRRAMILYTSGTTSKPKGVVTTHRNILAQITSLIDAWEWTANDHVLHVLPLHHTHGIVNVLLCALWAGAACEMLAQFDAETVWSRFVHSDLTLFMAVPTIYFKLIEAWEKATREEQQVLTQACSRMRLMVSGSAALPTAVFERWKAISGHTLLERYGMTEIGMALSNPLHGERRPGFVGAPLPGVEVRRVDESAHIIKDEGEPGEIQVRGPHVFLEYMGNPEATARAFRKDWFSTGDEAVVENGSYRILGRRSVDIIKTGGDKVSAIEIEEVLRTNPAIKECAVIGVEDQEWGERVCAAVILRRDHSLSLGNLRNWAKERLAKPKVPAQLLLLDELPRNIMGKVNKPELRKLFE